jgi:hypothetical protein
MNPKLNLILTAAGAGIALLGQGSMLSAAQAGPSLNATSGQSFNAGANFNLQQAQSFSATGNYSGIVSPFAVTAQSNTVASSTNFPGIAGNLSAGTSTLTAAFDKDGFQNTSDTTSFAVQAGVIGIGGNAPTAGVTTSAAGTIVTAGLALGIVFNQNTTSGVPSIAITGAGSDSGIISASITSQAIGASAASGNFTESLSVLNSLSAF